MAVVFQECVQTAECADGTVLQEFLRDIFNLLFLLPSLKDRQQPKCKSHSSRAAAYDLLVEMVKGSVENYRLLHNWVMAQHMQCKILYGAFEYFVENLSCYVPFILILF